MAEIPRETIFFAGEYEKQLDDKRRLTIPAKWRFKGDDADNTFLAVANVYGYITVLPPDMVADLYQKISKVNITNAAKHRAISNFLKMSDRFGCDKQGRIVISERLAKYAGLESGDVYMVGAGATFEIWNPKRRSKYAGEDYDESDAATLDELGI